jgi:hypothetical protein
MKHFGAMREFIVAGQLDVNGVHALIRLTLLLIVLAAIVWKLKGERDAT